MTYCIGVSPVFMCIGFIQFQRTSKGSVYALIDVIKAFNFASISLGTIPLFVCVYVFQM